MGQRAGVWKFTRPPMPCGICGTVFTPTGTRSQFCSGRCREAAKRVRKGLPPPRERLKKGLSCVLCGATFDQRGTMQRYCSVECRNAGTHVDGENADTMGPQLPETGRNVEETLRHVITPELAMALIRYTREPRIKRNRSWREAV